MKKLIISLSVGMLLGSAATALAATNETVQATFAKFVFKVNGQEKELKTTPLVVDGTSYLPVREISGLLGYELKYDPDSRTIQLDNGAKSGTGSAGGSATNNQNGDEQKMPDVKVPEYKVGEEFTIGKTTIKLNSVNYNDFMPYDPGDVAGFTASEGKTFAIVSFDVLTNEEPPTNRFDWSADNFIRTATFNEKISMGGSSTGRSMNIKLGEKQTVYVYFQIPDDAKMTRIEFKNRLPLRDLSDMETAIINL